MGNNPETPKKRKKRRMATGLAAAGAAAAAIGAYVASHMGNESLIAKDPQTETNAPAGVENADRHPVPSQQARTRFAVSEIVSVPDAAEETDKSDSGPSDDEVAKSILDQVADVIKNNLKPYDESYIAAIRAAQKGTSEKTQAVEAAERANAYYMDRGESFGANTLELRQGIGHRIADIRADISDGTAVVGFLNDSTYEKVVRITGVEPYNISNLIEDFRRVYDDYFQERKDFVIRADGAFLGENFNEDQWDREEDRIEENFKRNASEVSKRYGKTITFNTYEF